MSLTFEQSVLPEELTLGEVKLVLFNRKPGKSSIIVNKKGEFSVMFTGKIGNIVQQRLFVHGVTLDSINQVRYLFSSEELGIKRYEQSRKSAERAIRNHDFFKQNMKNRLTNPKCELLLLESDLRNLLHLMTSSKNDIQILQTALYQLIQKRPSYQGDKFNLGPVIMRMFHFLKLPDQALMFFNDEFIAPLFAQATTSHILCDLLYESQKYDDVLQTYEKLNSSEGAYANKYIDVIVLATYYQLNTRDAYDKALKLWKEISESGNQMQFRKSRTFVAGLAVNPNRPDVALDIVEGESMYATMRHIKLMAWAQTGQFSEIIKMPKTKFNSDEEKKGENVPRTSLEVLLVIEKALHRGTPDDKAVFRTIHEKIKAADLVTTDSFDDVICTPFMERERASAHHKTK